MPALSCQASPLPWHQGLASEMLPLITDARIPCWEHDGVRSRAAGQGISGALVPLEWFWRLVCRACWPEPTRKALLMLPEMQTTAPVLLLSVQESAHQLQLPSPSPQTH